MPRRMSAKDRLKEALHGLNGQKRKAADYIVAHSREVTMISLRKVAQRARVSPATLVLLARDLGYDSYVEFKSALQEEETGVLDYFSAGARALQDPKALSGLGRLAGTIAAADLRNVTATIDEKNAAAISRAAKIINDSRRVYVVGMRATFGVAHYLSYLLQLIRDDVVFIDDSAGMAADLMCGIEKSDVLVAYGFYPYVQKTMALVQQAGDAGAQVIAITDSAKSPLVRKRGGAVLFHTETPWVVGSITAAVSVSQIIVAQMVGLGGDAVLARLRKRDKLLTDLAVFAV